MRTLIALTAVALLSSAVPTIVTAQRGNAPPRPPAAPAPRWPDGRINLGAPLGQNGLWERRNEHLVINPKSYQADATKTARVHIDQVPLQPWARELTNHRHSVSLASEPYTRCKPAGGPRQFMSPYGLEIVEMPELRRIYIFNISNAMSYRTIYMDGRSHPKTVAPTYLGHSVGRWEGDTLVIDVTAFNGESWFDRAGNYQTSSLHVVERYTPVSRDVLQYEATIEDPQLYTRSWKITMPLYRRLEKNAQLVEYKCVEFAEELMYGHLGKGRSGGQGR
jgi:hypothetical protein